MLADRLAAARLLDQRDQGAQLLGAIVADIVEPVRRVAPAGLQFAIVRRWIVVRGDDTAYDVVGEGEIAAHFALIVVRDRFARAERLGERSGERRIGKRTW